MNALTTQNPQDTEFIRKGIDIWMIRDNLSLSFEERASQHYKTVQLIDELKQIGNRARSLGSSQIIDPQPR